MKKTILAMTLVVCMMFSIMPVFAGGTTAPEIVLDGTVGITNTGDYYADVTIENPVHNAVLMVALYQNKMLTGQEHILLTTTTNQVQLPIEASDADSAKFFVFESLDTVKPLGKVKEVQIPETPDYIVVTDGANLTGTYHNLIIAPEVGDGEVTLTGATVTGDMKVMGGGSQSIHLDSCTIEGKVIVEKEGGQTPRLNLIGTTLELVEAKTATLIEGEGAESLVRKVIATANVTADSAVVQKIEIPDYTEEKVDITIDGTTPVDVEVNTSIGVEVSGGNVTVSTTLEDIPAGIVQDGAAVTHLHKWSNPQTTQPTCEESGEANYACVDSTCSVTKTETIPALGHTYGKWEQFNETNHARVCRRDGSHIETEEHNWDEGTTVKEATKEEEGLKKFTCEVCGETKEEKIPVLSDVAFTFSYDQYQNPIITWSNNDYPNYYYEFEDSNGKSAANGWSEPGKNYATLLGLPTPESGKETYSFVLYAADENYNADWDNEFARLEDCVEVTISGDAFPYSMSFHSPEQGTHTITTGADIPENAIRMRVWYISGRRANASAGRNSNVIKAGTVFTENNSRVQDGDSMDFRIATTEIPNPQKLTATMTPPSVKTYLANDTTIFTFMESDGLKLAWKDGTLADGEKYLVTLKEPSLMYGTSKTYLPLGAFLARENVVEGTITAQVQKAAESEWTPNGDVHPETEVANITLNGTNPTYTIQRQEDGSYHFVSNMTGGAWVYEVYDENGNITYAGNVVNGAIDSYANFGDGSKIVARYITWTLNEDKTFAEISLSNRVELQYKQEGMMIIKEGDFLRLTWPDYGCYSYSVGVDNHNGHISHSSISAGATELSTLGNLLPTPESGENTYDLVLYEVDSSGTIGQELDRIENAITISVTGEPLSYDIAYDTPEAGTHTLTFDLTGYPEGSGMKRYWKNGSMVSRGYSMHAQETETVSKTLVEGAYCDYRIISPMEFENQKITMTMTPPSKKTYTADETDSNDTNARLSMDEDYLYLVFEDEAGLGTNEWYYVLQNGENITSDSVKEIELTWLLPGIEENTVLNYEIQKGTWQTKETIAKLDNAINITVTETAPNLQLVYQEDGTYKITGGGDTGYFYRVTTPEGERLATDYTMDDTFLCSIYEGCTVELQTGSITVAEDGMSAAITMSPVVRIENPTLPTGLNTVVEVSTADELLDAVNRGAIATLTTDITSEGMLKFKTGAPATIDLNGHTLTAPTIRAYYGKELTIDATKEGSAVNGNLVTTLEGGLTLNGGTYQKISLNNGRKFIANGITVQNSGGSDAVNIGRFDYVEINNSSCINTSSADYATGLYVWNCSEVKLDHVTASSVSNWFGADIAWCEAVEIIGGSYSAENSTGLRFVTCQNAKVDGANVSGSTQALLVQDGAVAEVNGGTFTSGSNNIIQLSREDSVLTINGGTFTANGDGSAKKIVVMEDTNTFVINGGIFTGVTGVTYSETANATVKGGTFSFDPSAYVESSSFVVPNEDGTFTVEQVDAPL